MAEVTTLRSKSGFVWIDIFNPKKSDIEELAKQHSLHSTSVQDCLDPEHLPKFERFSTYQFMILRAFDERSSTECDTVQELTRKVAIIYNDRFVITIHRKDQTFLANLRNKWRVEFEQREKISTADILSDLMKAIILTYELPIDNGLNQLELFEMGVFGALGSKPFNLEDGYYLKRKSFVFRRVMRLSTDVLVKLSSNQEFMSPPQYQDLRETLDGLNFYADELVENVNGLLNMYISLQEQKTNEASHRTNEVMRVLTVFSVFFMPLNFIASIYGMNFTHMPELNMEHAYPAVLLFMLFTSLSIYLWMRRKGWL